MAVEANSIGYATCLKIVELKYPNIFYSMPSHFNARNKDKIEKDLRNIEDMIPGFQTTSSTRPLAISQLEENVRKGSFIIHSTRTINELRTFIWKNGKPQAMSKYNDDLCMAAAIGLLIIDVTLKDLTRSKELSKAALNSIGLTTTEATTMKQLNIPENIWSNRRNSIDNQWVMIDASGEKHDLTWLIDKK